MFYCDKKRTQLKNINRMLLNLLICLYTIEPLNWFIYCCISWCMYRLVPISMIIFVALKLFVALNLEAMRFCTANLLQSNNIPIQIFLIMQQSWNGYWRGISYCLSFNKENEKKERKKKATEQVDYENFSKKSRETCFCTFLLFQLVFHLLVTFVGFFHEFL